MVSRHCEFVLEHCPFGPGMCWVGSCMSRSGLAIQHLTISPKGVSTRKVFSRRAKL